MVKELFNLTGRRALVTGSSQGIGRSIALALAEAGADVVVHCATDIAKAQAVCIEIESLCRGCGIVVADLAEADAATRIAAQAGDIDILVLNASVQIRKPWDQVTLEEYRRQIDVNLGASIWLIQRFAPAMRARKWGRIVTIGSVQQIRPHPEMLVYSATKAALVNVVNSLAPQFAPDGVTINNLAPGAIATGRNEQVLSNPEYLKKVLTKIPAGFIGEPVDCAGTALLLCSGAGRYVTGQDIFVDGGMGLPT